jgi:hypothetical protein
LRGGLHLRYPRSHPKGLWLAKIRRAGSPTSCPRKGVGTGQSCAACPGKLVTVARDAGRRSWNGSGTTNGHTGQRFRPDPCDRLRGAGAWPTGTESTVNRVLRLLERVRALLFGQPNPGCATPDTVSEAGCSLPVCCPSPEMWGAVLVGARRRRAPHLWSRELPTAEDDPVTSALVRPYLPPPEQCAGPLSPTPGEAR